MIFIVKYKFKIFWINFVFHYYYRDGTARVVLVGVAGVVPGGNRLVCCCRRCSEDLARVLNKFTCIHSAGKCWNRIGTSTSVVFTFFYDG